MNTTVTPDLDTPKAVEVMTDLALVINQGLDVRDVQRLVVEKAVLALGGTAGSVMMPGEKPGAMMVVATTGRGVDAPVDGPPESPVAEWVVRNDEPLLLLGRTGPLAHLLHREDIKDAVCVPLRYGGKAIGALSVSNSCGRGAFGEDDVHLLTSIGHLAAVALRNTMLYNDASEHRERLKAVLHRLWNAQEEERRRVAADLHDGPAQSLFNIVFRLQTARTRVSNDPSCTIEELDGAEKCARETLKQLRAIMSGLRPMSLDDLGLVPALRGECSAISARGRVNLNVVVTGEQRRLDADDEIGLFHVAREALSNVERHAGVDTATLRLDFRRDCLKITICDNGVGFDAEAERMARAAGRIGRSAMKERADALGISLYTESEIGKGTSVHILCPLDKQKASRVRRTRNDSSTPGNWPERRGVNS